MQRITRRERYIATLRITHLPEIECGARRRALPCATFENNERNTRAEAIISQLIRCREQVSLMQRHANTRVYYKVTKKMQRSGPGVIPNKTRSLNQCHAAEINSWAVISAKSTTVDAAHKFIPSRNIKCCAQ